MALRVGNEDFEEKVIKAVLPVIAEFYSDSCVPCKQMAAILGDLEEEYEKRVIIVKVNVNFSPELAEKYQVMASPTILFFQSGEERKRLVGLKKKPEIKEIIETIIKERTACAESSAEARKKYDINSCRN